MILEKTINKPIIGVYYSPFKNENCCILKLVKEDEQFWYFEDFTKYSKDMEFSWFEREKPADKTESNEPFVFPYDSYSLWSRQLAETLTIKELQKVVDELDVLGNRYAKQHLSAIEATTSMQSQSQRRAQSRNNLTANYEKKRAYKDAIELHQYYPSKCKHTI